MEELFAALIIGISFSNALVCILLGFGMTSAENKKAGKYFILGRFLGLVFIGMIIALFGMIFDGYVLYLLILFGVLTIIFGALVIAKIYYRSKNNHKHQKKCASKHYSRRALFLLGAFRGATPCFKIFILAPLLIVVDMQLAFLMILVFASASTLYPVIGFLSANLLSNFRRYDAYVQVTGAVLLISIGTFTIIKQLLAQSCPIGI